MEEMNKQSIEAPVEEENILIAEDLKSEPVEEVVPKKKKLGTYKKGLIIYVSVLGALAIGLLVVLWIFLSSYQQSLSAGKANEYLDSISKKQWIAYITENLEESPYGSDAEVDIAYGDFIKGKELYCSRFAPLCTDDLEVYNISNGTFQLGKIELKRQEDGAFGFARWKARGFYPTEQFLKRLNRKINIITPDGSTVTLNGVGLGEGCKTAPYSLEYTVDPYTCYNLREPWGEYKIEGSSNGKTLVVKNPSEREYLVSFSDKDIYSYTYTVPAGTELYFDDQRLSTDFISEGNKVYPYISPLEKEHKDAPKANVYTVKTARDGCTVKATYDGKELAGAEIEGGYEYKLPYESKDYTLTAPADLVVKVNGIAVNESDEYIETEESIYPAVTPYESLLKNPKILRRYKFEGLLFKPVIEVIDSDGTSCELSADSAIDFSCAAPPSADKIPLYEQKGKEFCRTMIDLMHMGQEHLAENYNAALGFALSKSPAYTTIKDAYTAAYWRSAYEYKYNDLYVDNYISYADNAFRCDVHYDLTAKRLENVRIENTKGIYRVLYINTSGGWRIAELTLLSEE